MGLTNLFQFTLPRVPLMPWPHSPRVYRLDYATFESHGFLDPVKFSVESFPDEDVTPQLDRIIDRYVNQRSLLGRWRDTSDFRKNELFIRSVDHLGLVLEDHNEALARAEWSYIGRRPPVVSRRVVGRAGVRRELFPDDEVVEGLYGRYGK